MVRSTIEMAEEAVLKGFIRKQRDRIAVRQYIKESDCCQEKKQEKKQSLLANLKKKLSVNSRGS